MNIVIVSPEAVPFAKTGGLADVAGALLQGLSRTGHDAFLFMPLYRGVRGSIRPKEAARGQKIFMGERAYYFDILSQRNAFFISNDYFFDRDGLYGDSRGDFPDNPERFAFFCLSVLHATKILGIKPDIYHLHDWQTALLPLYRRELFTPADNAAAVLTIHNVGYQGIFPPETLPRLGISGKFFTIHGIEFHGNLNLLKAGILYSDRVTTVSPTYAHEITFPEYGFGLEGSLRWKGVTGILNGIDYDLWNPADDIHLKRNYTIQTLHGRAACKEELLSVCRLRDRSLPLIGSIGRIIAQKGYDLIADCLEDIIGLGANIVILGRGDRDIEQVLQRAAARFRDRVHVSTLFNEPLARKIYAGSDLFLMPSRYEPCGLAQMIAMRYGSIPIVRKTGGLADTVTDFNSGSPEGTGFLFHDADRNDLVECIKRALCVWKNKRDWNRLTRNAMRLRFSWEHSISQYSALYGSLVGRQRNVPQA